MIIHVRVKAAQRKDALWRDEAELVAYIRGVPKDGEANTYLEVFLAKQFGVAKSTVSVVKGATSKYKTIDILAPESTITKAIAALEAFPQSTLF